MAQQVRGVVSRVYERDWKGKRGTVTLHSFQLEDDRTYYRTGEDKIAEEGECVEFEYEEDDKGNAVVIAETLAQIEKPRAVKAPSSSRGSGRASKPTSSGSKPSSAGATKEAYWDAKDARDQEKERHNREVVEPRITVASAQSDAVALVAAALAADLINFGNANKGAKLTMLLDHVDQVTKRFAVTRWNAAGVLKDAVAEATPEEEEIVDESDEDEELE